MSGRTMEQSEQTMNAAAGVAVTAGSAVVSGVDHLCDGLAMGLSEGVYNNNWWPLFYFLLMVVGPILVVMGVYKHYSFETAMDWGLYSFLGIGVFAILHGFYLGRSRRNRR